MDYDYWLRMDRAGREIRYLPEPLARSRLHPQTKTSRNRSEIYQEIFEVCRRHGGYVDRNYVVGYWAQRAEARTGILGALLAITPAGPSIAGRLQHAWQRHDGSAWSFVTRTLPARVARLLRQWRARRGLPRGRRVDGVYDDGACAPLVIVHAAADRPGEARRFIAGSSTVDGRVEIAVDGVVAVTRRLVAAREVRVEIPVRSRGEVRVRFGAGVVDRRGRNVALVLTGTDLFEERDLGDA